MNRHRIDRLSNIRASIRLLQARKASLRAEVLARARCEKWAAQHARMPVTS
jgi:hypothetical protein